MPTLTPLKRSQLPFIRQLYQFQRLQTGQLSDSPPSSAAFCDTNNQHKNRTQGSLIRWFSGIAAGSGLGLMYWSVTCSSDSESESEYTFFNKSWLSSFADWSTASIANQSHKLSLPAYTSNFIFGDSYRRKIFFNYEKRIRLRSPPEKVFQYFASYQAPDGELLMKPADLMRAVVPVFPPSESHLVRDGYLSGERVPGELRCASSDFFMLFDVNSDGLISFKEYIFFVTLLSIPESSFSVAFKMFDIDNNGAIDREEFKKVMQLMRAHNRQGAAHKDGLRTGLKVRGHVENGGLVEYFFGKDGKERLQHDKFVQFMRNLHDEMVRLEFAHYDYKLQGTISANDFALSMVASADVSHLDRLLDRVDELHNEPHLLDMRITLEEFKDFAALRKKLLPFSLALFSYGEVNGLLTREDFQRAASQVCGISLTNNVIDIIFHVFDLNRDGNLSANEFVRVLLKRERDIAQPIVSGIVGYLSCCLNCEHNNPIGQLLA